MNACAASGCGAPAAIAQLSIQISVSGPPSTHCQRSGSGDSRMPRRASPFQACMSACVPCGIALAPGYESNADDVRGERVHDVVLARVEVGVVGRVPVDAVRPVVHAGDLGRVIQHARLAARLVLRGIQEVGPRLQLARDHGLVVDEAGRAPRLADRVVVGGVPGAAEVGVVHVLDVRDEVMLSLLSRPFSTICGMNTPVGTTMS